MVSRAAAVLGIALAIGGSPPIFHRHYKIKHLAYYRNSKSHESEEPQRRSEHNVDCIAIQIIPRYSTVVASEM
jgi:hypothetical protein